MTPRTLATLGLLGTLAIGVALRWVLAGVVPMEALGTWAHVRSAHTHLGYYGVLFPLVWAAWRELGRPAPGPGSLAAYAVAVAVATIGFATQGYALASIAGSTVVLLAWLVSAAPLLREVPGRSWLATVAPSVVLAAVAIPAVAVLTKRGHPLALPLVRGFLAWLLFGVGFATALHRLRAPTAPAGVALLGVIAAGLAIGPWPTGLAHLGLAAYGAVLTQATWRAAAPVSLRALWAVVGLGLAAVGLGLWPLDSTTAIAGLHVAVLGPWLATLAWPARWRAALPVYALLVGAFGLTILGPTVWPWAGWPTASALAGTLIAAVWTGRAFVRDGP